MGFLDISCIGALEIGQGRKCDACRVGSPVPNDEALYLSRFGKFAK
jgi:hypothetical protein